MPTAQSNVEKYLAVIAGHDAEIPTQPASRVEWYLNEILQNGGGGESSLKVKIVASLPAAGVSGILYLVPSQQGSGQNLYDEYVWVEDETKFELLGQTGINVDLSGYVPNTRKVGGKTLERDVGITISGASPVHISDNGTATTVAYEISHEDSGVTAGTKGDASNQTPDFGETFKTISETVNATGHVTNLSEHAVKIPDAKASASRDGLMSKEDKAKLDKLVPKGSAAKGVYIDAAGDTREMSYELKAEVPENFAVGTETPLTDGAASIGVSMKYAREDHVHPVDESRASVVEVENLKNENALLRELIRGIDAPVYRTASGNPASFADGYDNATLKELTVTITPAQSGTPSVESPIPIPGYDNVTLIRTGKNLFDGATTNYYVTATGEITGNGSARLSDYIFVGGATFTVSATPLTASNSETLRVALYDAKKNFLERVTSTRNAASFTVKYPAAAYVRIGWFTTAYSSDGVTLELGNAASGYEAYRGQSVSVSLSPAGRVYGGIVNAVAGTLTVTHGQIASYDGETVPDGWISSTGELSTGAQVVYPLDTPLSYQLTPVSLTSLSGYNSVSADAGAVYVTYRADMQITLGG